MTALAPDTEDRTWVLERPRVECCFEAAALDPADLGAVVRDDVAG